MPAQAPATQAPILTPPDAAARMALLAELQATLTRLGIQCVLARHHRLVLRYAEGPVPPSGLTNPTLHVVAAGGTETITTDGATYRLSTGQELPADDSVSAAALICLQQPAGPPAHPKQQYPLPR
jgi:hypothetical protein